MDKLYLDLETREIVPASVIFQEELDKRSKDSSKFEWLKIYPAQLEDMPKMINSQAYSVAHEVFYGASKATCEYVGSYDDIAFKTGVPRITVARTMKKMIDFDYIRPVKKGVYMVNPSKRNAGSDNKKIALEQKYYALKKPDKKTVVSVEEEYNSELLGKVEALL